MEGFFKPRCVVLGPILKKPGWFQPGFRLHGVNGKAPKSRFGRLAHGLDEAAEHVVAEVEAVLFISVVVPVGEEVTVSV